MKQQNSPNMKNTNSPIDHLLNATKIAFLSDHLSKNEVNSSNVPEKTNFYPNNNKQPEFPNNAGKVSSSNGFSSSIFRKEIPGFSADNLPNDLSNLGDLNGYDKRDNNDLKKRKRNRKIKSCKFCYRRHLKCDKTKPICSICVEKGFDECEYYSDDELGTQNFKKQKKEVSYISSRKDSLTDSAQTVIMEGVRSYAKKHDILTSEDIKSKVGSMIGINNDYKKDMQSELKPNPLLQSPTVMVKDERLLFFGPTCFRSSIARIDDDKGILKRVFKVWDLFKKEKNELRKNFKFSLSQEAKFLDYNSSEQDLLKEIVQVIPKTRQELKYYVSLYFKSPLYDTLRILNEEAVYSYIDEVFEEDVISETIVNITFTNKRNYYKAGIVMFILGLTFYGTILPDCITGFFIFLQGQSTGKMMFIEKIQFLVLKCFFSFVNGYTGGDFSHLVNLVGIMANTMIEFQLNTLTVETVYKNEPSLKYVENILGGNFKLLSRMFYVGMFVDVVCSYQNGKPLFISSLSYPDEWLLIKEEPDEKNSVLDCKILNKLKLFLYYSRRLLGEIYKPVGVPQTNKLLDNLFLFCHHDLRLNEMCYIDNIPKDKEELNFCIIMSFLTSFAIDLGISVLAVKRDLKFNDTSTEEKNEIFTTFTGNQLCYYCLCVNQVTLYLTKCIHQRQLIFEEEHKTLMLNENLKTIGCDKVIFFLSFAPRFCTGMRSFTEFFKVLFCTSLLTNEVEASYEYMEKLLAEDRIVKNPQATIIMLRSKEKNSEGLREFVKNTDIMKESRKTFTEDDSIHSYYLSKIYDKFHPAMFQKGDLNENLAKIEFTGLQLYGWFTMLHDEQTLLDDSIQEETIQFRLHVAHLTTKQNFARSSFNSFLETLKELRDKKFRKKSQNLLKQTLDRKSSSSNYSATPVPTLNENSKLTPSSYSTANSNSPINIFGTPSLHLSPMNFDFSQKSFSMNNKTGRSNSNVLVNLPGSPMFGWDMNFVDFSSKMNWFMNSPLPPTEIDENEIKFLTSSIQTTRDKDKKDEDKDDKNAAKNNALLNSE